MAASVSSDDEFLCSICLDLFTDPVSTPCGHNFCERCLCQHWDISALCRCPLCKELFHTRPDLKVNKLLSEVVSRLKLETRRRSEVSKPGEVSCDFCTGPKLKALKSCLVCLSSFCEMHLQPHLNVPGLKSHQLMEPVENIQDRMCPQHHKPLELFCRSDHSCVCTMCALLEHQSHKFVSLREEFEQRKVSLQQKQEESQQMVEQRRQKIQELQRSLELSERAADTEKTMGLQAFNALIETVQRSRESFMLELQEKLRQDQTHTEVLVQQLQLEIYELQHKISEAEQLQRSEDHLHFLQHCPALPPTGLKDCSSITLELQRLEGTAAGALAKLEKNLKDTLGEEMKKVASGEFKSAQNFAMNLTLDPESASTYLSVSDNLKEVHHTNEKKFSDGPQRFSWYTIITKRSISSGRCYFEVQVKDKTQWYLGLVKQSVNRRKVLNSENGYWSLYMKNRDEYYACADPLVSLSLKCAPQKVGVFVNYSKGLISFYNADTEELIYSFTNCCFTETLFPFLNPCSNNEGVNSAPLILSTVKK